MAINSYFKPSTFERALALRNLNIKLIKIILINF